MKRIILMGLLSFLPAMFVLAKDKNKEPETCVTVDYSHLSPFSGLYFSMPCKIELIKGDNFSVNVTAQEKVVKHLDVKLDDGVLHFAAKGKYKTYNTAKIFGITVHYSRGSNKTYEEFSANFPKVQIVMPELDLLYLCESNEMWVSDEDVFASSGSTCKIIVTGSAKIYGLNLSSQNLEVEISGISESNISGTFDDVDINVSGITHDNFHVVAEEVNVKTSGVGTISLSGTIGLLKVNAGGVLTIDAQNASVDKSKIKADSGAKVLMGQH